MKDEKRGGGSGRRRVSHLILMYIIIIFSFSFPLISLLFSSLLLAPQWGPQNQTSCATSSRSRERSSRRWTPCTRRSRTWTSARKSASLLPFDASPSTLVIQQTPSVAPLTWTRHPCPTSRNRTWRSRGPRRMNCTLVTTVSRSIVLLQIA